MDDELEALLLPRVTRGDCLVLFAEPTEDWELRREAGLSDWRLKRLAKGSFSDESSSLAEFLLRVARRQVAGDCIGELLVVLFPAKSNLESSQFLHFRFCLCLSSRLESTRF